MSTTPPNIIFLDVDGVLNSARSFTAYKDREDNICDALDPIAVEMIKLLCKECNAKIVWCSTWRRYEDQMNLLEKFIPTEFWFNSDRAAIHDWATPIRFSERPRQNEINEWREDHPDQFARWVWVDDHIYVEGDNFFPTNSNYGLSADTFYRIHAYLLDYEFRAPIFCI